MSATGNPSGAEGSGAGASGDDPNGGGGQPIFVVPAEVVCEYLSPDLI